MLAASCSSILLPGNDDMTVAMEAEAVEGLLTATNLLIRRPSIGEATGKIWESSGKCELFEFAYVSQT